MEGIFFIHVRDNGDPSLSFKLIPGSPGMGQGPQRARQADDVDCAR